MSLAFIPLYVKFLGIEAYGLMGIFAMLQAWLVLLDMGMKPTLSREMARYTVGAHSPQYIRDLLRSVEVIAVIIAALVTLFIWLAATWLATRWLKPQALPPAEVARALALMGAVMGFRFIEDVYAATMVGLQRQVLDNAVTISTATLRALGAVCVLAYIAPTIEAFFVWQGVVSLITVAVYGQIVYRSLPASPLSGRFSIRAVADIWRFAAGMTLISLLALLLTQIDKILLSRILTLRT